MNEAPERQIDTVKHRAPTRTAPSLFKPFSDLWYIRFPVWLDPWAPQVADAFTDGAWTVAWLEVAALLPSSVCVVSRRSRDGCCASR